MLDPPNPHADSTTPPSKAVDLMGEEVAGAPSWNEGAACLATSFFEIAESNGLIDMWEHTALDSVRSAEILGPVNSAPEVVTFFGEIVEMLTFQYNLVWDSYNRFTLEAPMKGGDPQSIIKETLKNNQGQCNRVQPGRNHYPRLESDHHNNLSENLLVVNVVWEEICL